jgi:hypothetical protein
MPPQRASGQPRRAAVPQVSAVAFGVGSVGGGGAGAGGRSDPDPDHWRGGWGDRLDRDVAAVVADVRDRKVAVAGARAGYGVVMRQDVAGPAADGAAATELRRRLRAGRPAHRPFFDRGPGYARLSGGAPHADVDMLGTRGDSR